MTTTATDLPDEEGKPQQTPTQEVPGAPKEEQKVTTKKGGAPEQKDVETPK